MQRLFLYVIGFGCQKVCAITFIVKLHKRNMESFSLCNGDKTHESWKPLRNTIHAFSGLSECLHNETCNISFALLASLNLNAGLLTPRSIYMDKNYIQTKIYSRVGNPAAAKEYGKYIVYRNKLQSQKSQFLSRFNASSTRLVGRARLTRMPYSLWNGRPSCQQTPTDCPFL